MKAGTFIYLYIFNSFHCENASCEHAMLKNGASGEISRYKCWLVVSSDEMSPYTSGSRTFSVTDRRLITDLSTAPYDQKDLCVFCRTTLLWSRWQQNTAGSLKRPNQRRRQRGGGTGGLDPPYKILAPQSGSIKHKDTAKNDGDDGTVQHYQLSNP